MLESEGHVANETMLNSVACIAICGHDTIALNCLCLGQWPNHSQGLH